MSRNSILQKSSIFMTGLLFGMAYASDSADKEHIKSNLEVFQKGLLDTANKCVVANELLQAGVLKNVLRNGEFIDYPTGRVVEFCIEKDIALKAFVQELLESGDTITASTRMRREENLENGTLNLKCMRLTTVEDWKKQDWFSKVHVLDLTDNQLVSIQVSFFELFPNLEKVILTSNPLRSLDTTYMPYGLEVVAEHTALASISSTTLHKNGYLFKIAQTPLAQNWPMVASYCDKCTQKQESVALRIYNRCCGKSDDTERDKGSRIEIIATR